MAPLDNNCTTTTRAVTLLDDAHLANARVLPQPPLTLADILTVALDRPEDFTFDLYEHGCTMGAPLVIWAYGAPQMLREILDIVSLDGVIST